MDSTTDNSFRTLWSIVKVAGAPDYISNGMLVDGKDAEGLPDGSFADTVQTHGHLLGILQRRRRITDILLLNTILLSPGSRRPPSYME